MKNSAILPIFDKLTIEESGEKNDNFNDKISLELLKKSIQKDLTYLLNTRFFPLWNEYYQKIYFPYTYGANLTGAVTAETVFEIQQLENKILNAITQFEPRLKNVRVHITNNLTDPSKIFIAIEANIFIENKKIPLTFPILMDIK